MLLTLRRFSRGPWIAIAVMALFSAVGVIIVLMAGRPGIDRYSPLEAAPVQATVIPVRRLAYSAAASHRALHQRSGGS